MDTTITISLEVWQQLKALKERPGESFNEILIKLLANYKDKEINRRLNNEG